jgi:hypothetical protein
MVKITKSRILVFLLLGFYIVYYLIEGSRESYYDLLIAVWGSICLWVGERITAKSLTRDNIIMFRVMGWAGLLLPILFLLRDLLRNKIFDG